jgi:hypothetical protein
VSIRADETVARLGNIELKQEELKRLIELQGSEVKGALSRSAPDLERLPRNERLQRVLR